MSVTDDERRRVACNIRDNYLCDGLGITGVSAFTIARAIGMCPEIIVDDADFWSRLANLIDPGAAKAPTSSDTASTRADATEACDGDVDPTERGIDSIHDWCFERLEGADGAEDYLYCTIMSAIEDYRHPELATAHTVRAVDRDALLALADEMDELCGPWRDCGEHYARRIREALGIKS